MGVPQCWATANKNGGCRRVREIVVPNRVEKRGASMMADAAFDEEEDDPVVEEFPVYLSKALAENLYIFQHKVRRNTAPYDDTPVVSARVKPKQSMVELEFALDTDLSCYNKSKGEEIAINAISASGDPYFKGSLMDKQMLVSSVATTMPQRYAVGLFKDGALHLSPLKGILEFRPSFPHMSHGGPKKGANSKDAGETVQAEEDEAKPVTVRFARPETERAKKARERSFKFLQQRKAEEAWINVKYNHYKSESSEIQRSMLQCQAPDEEVSELNMTMDDYLKKFIPETTDVKYVQPNLSNNAGKQSMPMPDQITALMTNAKVLTFDRLQTLLSHDIEPNAALRGLQQVGVLVQGCWVVKSDVLYPKGTSSPHSGVSAEILCKARDYIMWRFTQAAVTTRKEILTLIKLPQEDLMEMLQQIARWRPKVGWEFKLPKDETFIRRNPDVVQRQIMLWDAKYQQLLKLFKMPTMKIKEEIDYLKSPKGGPRKQRSRPTSEGKSEDGDKEKANRTRISLTTTSSSVTVQARLLQQLDISVIKQEPMDQDDVETTSNEHGAGETSGCLDDVEDHQAKLKEELTKFVRDKLHAFSCLTLIELKERLHSKLAESPPGYILGKGVSDRLLETTIKEVGGVQVNAMWPNGLNEDAIYALSSAGDQLDPFRKGLIALYKIGPRFRKCHIKKKVEEFAGSPLQECDLNKLIKDYCFSLKQGFFTLKFAKVPNS